MRAVECCFEWPAYESRAKSIDAPNATSAPPAIATLTRVARSRAICVVSLGAYVSRPWAERRDDV